MVDAICVARPNVEDLALHLGFRCPHKGDNHIRDEGEVPGLSSVSHYRKRLSGQLLRQKDTKDSAIGSGPSTPWTVDVEEPE